MPEVALGVAAVARRLGVATGTLRTWDRRYGLGPSEHEAGSRRRYTARDLARLDLMHRLMLQGVSAGEAARAALSGDPLPDGGSPPALPGPERRPRGRRRPGGGRVVALRDASPAARGLARAAMSLDAETCTTLLVTALRRRGVVATWDDLLLPVLAGLGERWRTTGAGVEVEHLLSECAEAALHAGVRGPRQRPTGRPVLLAGLEAEGHRLPLAALAAALTERGVPIRMLGVHLPVRGLGDAIRRTGPAAVFLWARGAGGPATLPPVDLLTTVRPRPALVLGGAGYQDEQWRAGATWVGGLDEAVLALSGPRAGGPGSAAGGAPAR